jgi:hypothetical protein
MWKFRCRGQRCLKGVTRRWTWPSIGRARLPLTEGARAHPITLQRNRCMRSRVLHTALQALAVTGLLAAIVTGSSAQAQDDPPAAADLVARHVAAIGGRETLLAKKSVRTRGTFEMPAMGVRGDFDAAQARDGSMVMKMVVSGIGEIASGFDGEHAWSTNPMTGPRLLEGTELAQIRDDASFLASLREPPVVKSMQTVGVSEAFGESCYRVKVSWASGRETHDCYSMETGLLIGTENAQLSPTGALDITTTFADYRDFGGVRMATTATQRAAGQEQVLRFTSVEFDSAPAELFAPPPPVAAMIDRQKGTAAPK